MAKPLASATGRRKESTAHVKLMPGDGKITVNGKSALEYLKRDVLVMMVEQPLQVTETIGTYDIVCNTKGGGLSGQAGAIRLGVSRSLIEANEGYRQSLRDFGLLTRDPREVERKKPGRPGARRRFQFSKR